MVYFINFVCDSSARNIEERAHQLASHTQKEEKISTKCRVHDSLNQPLPDRNIFMRPENQSILSSTLLNFSSQIFSSCYSIQKC